MATIAPPTRSLTITRPSRHDLTRGMQPLLDTVFVELALERPGLFGPVGLTALFPIPPATLRDLVMP